MTRQLQVRKRKPRSRQTGKPGRLRRFGRMLKIALIAGPLMAAPLECRSCGEGGRVAHEKVQKEEGRVKMSKGGMTSSDVVRCFLSQECMNEYIVNRMTRGH